MIAASIDSPSLNTPTGPGSPKGKETIRRVEAGMQSGTAHCLPELIEIIQTLSGQGQEIQVGDLCELMEKHVAVMSKVVTAATTLGYNPSRLEINTLSHAVQVIGFDRIRSLVTTLLLVRHAMDSEHAREQKEAAIGAVCAGLTAQEVSTSRKVANPEQAFLAASLRHLGRLLLSTYLRDDYKAVMAEIAHSSLSEKTLFQQRFGLTPVELTRAILLKAKFPQSLLDTLQEPENVVRKRRPGAEDQATLMDVSVFAERITQLSLSRKVAPENFAQRARSVCASLPEELDHSETEMKELLGSIGDNLGSFTEQMGFGTIASNAIQMCRCREGKGDMPPETFSTPPLPLPATASNASSTNDGASPATGSPATGPAVQAVITPAAGESPAVFAVQIGMHAWKEGLVNLTAFLHDPTMDPAALLAAAADVVREGFGSPEFVLLSLDPDDASFRVTHGRGKVFGILKNTVAMKKGERTALGVCALRKENVLIHDTSDPKTLAYLPKWGTQSAGWGSFVAVPFHDTKNCFAVVLVAWSCPCQLVLEPEQTRLLRSIGSMVAAARRMAA